MNLAIIIYSNDPEVVWNAFRLGNTALGYDKTVSIFLLGKGVECLSLNSIKYNIREQLDYYEEYGGKLVGCDLCCELREDEMPFLREDLNCEMGSMQNLYDITMEADKVITF